MELHKAKVISLKNHAVLDEKWLQEQIVADPTILGLGDLVVRDVERIQPHAGRLDLLLEGESDTRYEVEIQLGTVDESHIIRTIEYWDLERRRYPQYDHIAVIIAEEITNRFFNVISLFNGFIPLIAIQLNLLEVNGCLTINSTKVLDNQTLGTDEEDSPALSTDRSYWEKKSSKQMLAVVDDLFKLASLQQPDLELRYNKFYIGIRQSGVANNFILFKPRKKLVRLQLKIHESPEIDEILDGTDIPMLDYNKRGGYYCIQLNGTEIEKYKDVILDLMARAYARLNG